MPRMHGHDMMMTFFTLGAHVHHAQHVYTAVPGQIQLMQVLQGVHVEDVDEALRSSRHEELSSANVAQRSGPALRVAQWW